jgi:flagellar hook assembly protein FlgD
VGTTLPNSFALLQNYPNPFNPSTNIDFSTPEPGIVTLVVYDVLGRQVQILMNGIVPAGNHSVQWDGRDSGGMHVGSGVYFYRLAAGLHQASTKKMLVMR